MSSSKHKAFSDINDSDGIVRVARISVAHPLSTYSKFGFVYQDKFWPSVEHFFQAMKYSHDSAYQEKIRESDHPKKARKLGRTWFRRVVKDWRHVRIHTMYTGCYNKFLQNEEAWELLDATEDKLIVEPSQYDYFWGIGRDGRGKNIYGKTLMRVRHNIRQLKSTTLDIEKPET